MIKYRKHEKSYKNLNDFHVLLTEVSELLAVKESRSVKKRHVAISLHFSSFFYNYLLKMSFLVDVFVFFIIFAV